MWYSFEKKRTNKTHKSLNCKSSLLVWCQFKIHPELFVMFQTNDLHLSWQVCWDQHHMQYVVKLHLPNTYSWEFKLFWMQKGWLSLPSITFTDLQLSKWGKEATTRFTALNTAIIASWLAENSHPPPPTPMCYWFYRYFLIFSLATGWLRSAAGLENWL